jgi:hypothetical protein
MVEISRENQSDPTFDVEFLAAPDGVRCTVRSGNVTLTAGPFKSEAIASVWVLKAVHAGLQLRIDELSLQGLLKAAPQFRPIMPALPPLCSQCGHGKSRHEKGQGQCWADQVVADVDHPFERCPCSKFDPELPTPRPEVR